MEIDALFFQRHEAMLMGVAAVLCGTALLHLVLIRMIRKREHQKERTNSSDQVESHMIYPPVFFPAPIHEQV